ncbi:TPA: hypothetical protein DDZ86_03890 [Candidatus Dependentiae bacterium]|nr:MAG: Metalloprotease/cell division cycle protein [candidate division TM6 bacterium GW2011_GWF2_43_87]HBL98758.1 hypothetical protein [Candidatus Dependentiae bacterium]
MNKLLLMFMCAIGLSSALSSTVQKNSPTSEAESSCSQETERLKTLYGEFSQGAADLSATIEHLAQRATRHKIGNPALLNETIDWLLSAKDILTKALQEPIVTLTPTRIASSFRTVNLIGQAIETEINSNFATLPLLDYDTITQTRIFSTTSLDDVEFYARNTTLLVSRVSESAHNSGLSWFNQQYTTASDWAHRTGILRRLTQTAIIGSSAFLVYLLAAPERFIPEGPLKKLREKINGTLNNVLNGSHIQELNTLLAMGASVSTITNNVDIPAAINKAAYAVDAKLRGIELTSGNVFEPMEGKRVTLDSPLFDYIRKDLDPLLQIYHYIKNPKGFAHIKICRSILLVGPSGSGKSFIIRALAELCSQAAGNVSIIVVDSTELFSSEGFKNILQRARTNAITFVIMDEFQNIGGGPQKKTNWAVVEDLLHGFDELNRDNDPHHQVFFIGATNCPHEISKALLRPGRIDRIIELSEPNTEGRKTILSTLCKEAGINPDDINVDLLSKISKGASVSALNKFLEEAIRRAKLNNMPVSFEDAYEALNDTLRRLHRQIQLSPNERKVVCTHLAGIATAHLFMTTPEKLESITLRAPQKKIVEKYDWQVTQADANEQNNTYEFKPNYGLYYTYGDNDFISAPPKTDPYMMCKIKLAGKVAEELVLGYKTSYHPNAHQEAYNEALAIISRGIDIKTLSPVIQAELQTTAWNKIKEAEEEVKQLLSTHINLTKVIADNLDKKEFLRIDEIKDAVKTLLPTNSMPQVDAPAGSL